MDWDEYLREAYNADDMEEIRHALEQGADPNIDLHHDGHTIFYWAAFGQKMELARMLLQAGAKVAKEEKSYTTSVHTAVEHNNR